MAPTKERSSCQLPQIAVGILDFLKLLDFFTDLLKISLNRSAAGDMWNLAVMTFVMASVVVVMKAYDQVCLLMRAARWGSNTRCCLGCITLPMLPLLPINWMSVAMYSKKKRAEDGHLTVFARRPMGTLLMGLPGYSILSAWMSDKHLVLHPMQAHLRAIQSVWQTALQDVPDIVIDIIIIIEAPENENVRYFWISFFYSIFLTLVLLVTTVTEIHHIERSSSMPPAPASTGAAASTSALPAIEDRPSA